MCYIVLVQRFEPQGRRFANFHDYYHYVLEFYVYAVFVCVCGWEGWSVFTQRYTPVGYNEDRRDWTMKLVLFSLSLSLSLSLTHSLSLILTLFFSLSPSLSLSPPLSLPTYTFYFIFIFYRQNEI